MKNLKKIELYTLNNFLKFERKLYQIFGYELGRPIRLKAILYFVVIGIIEIFIYFTPIIGNVINWMPFAFLLVIPIGAAWLLSDVGTEDRLPMRFFRSFFKYHFRTLRKTTMYRGREVMKEMDYQFQNYVTYRCLSCSKQELNKYKQEDKNRKKQHKQAVIYMQDVADRRFRCEEENTSRFQKWKLEKKKIKRRKRIRKVLRGEKT